MIRHQFSGHDSFVCKQFWLKKGFDYLTAAHTFSDENAVVKLGVGKNMVTAVQYWMKCFGIMAGKNQPTEIGSYIFNDKKGKDPYIESIDTIWLLHYLLVKTDHATLYNLFFNEFRRQRIEFSKEQLLAFVEKKQRQANGNYNANTVNNDISVFIRTYIKPSSKNTREGIEEDFSSVLVDLQLMEQIDGRDFEGKKVDYFKVESGMRTDIPAALILFSILDARPESKSVSFKELHVGKDMPGSIFAMSKEGLFTKIQQIEKEYKKHGVTFTETVNEIVNKTKTSSQTSIQKFNVRAAYAIAC